MSDPAAIGGLQLSALLDDGFNVWINGVHVLSQNMPGNEVTYDATANQAVENIDYQTFVLPAPSGYLKTGANVIAIEAHNSGLSSSSDFFLDVRLEAGGGASQSRPTPGARNVSFAENIPPQIRQVNHAPEQPASGQTVRVTAKVTDPDGVDAVTLLYQVVDPGNYIELADPAYQTNWVSVPMNDLGQSGDEKAGDNIFTGELPASVQVHRRLVRYRITGRDKGNHSITVPYPDDPQPNFAYFVYDGVPSWSGAIDPTSADSTKHQLFTYGTNVMRKLPVYHLIAKKDSVEHSTWIDRYGGDLYKWSGTLVYDGKVYDHIHYRARGGVWRYAMGKNMWKFDFNRGHDFQARDNYGKKDDVGWTKLNLGACIQQGDFGHRGEQGMFESVGFRLFNLAGVEAPNTHFVQFRIIDEAAESNPTNQYQGDFWGLYLAIEQEDGRFLDEHGLPDGNFYKMEGGTGTLNNQGATAVTDRSDLDRFIGTYSGTNPSETWWRTNLDLGRYYSYRTIVEAIHHYDIDQGAGKNYFYYLNPVEALWSVHSWDLDMTWADSMYGGGDEPFRSRVLATSRPAFNLEYRNRIREIRDLLYNTDQAYQLIDEYAAMIRDPKGGPSMVEADRAQWDYNPIMASSYVLPSKAGKGRFYQIAATKDFPGMVVIMKNYVKTRSALLDRLATDASIPSKPVVTYAAGLTNYPINRLVFRSSDYAGANPFAAMQWRIGEVTPATIAPFVSDKPRKYEIQAVWESPVTAAFANEMTIPSDRLEAGRTYRVRVKMQDTTGRWSNWSDPVEFTASEPIVDSTLPLRISEIMYHPPAGSDFEFVELLNTGTAPIELFGPAGTWRLDGGIQLAFPTNITVAAGGYLVGVNFDPADETILNDFKTLYGAANSTARFVGPYQGKLSNSGDRVALERSSSAGSAENSWDLVDEVNYLDQLPWPVEADGTGASLHRTHLEDSGNNPQNWSAAPPSPGRADGAAGNSDSDGDGLPDAWETSHGLNPNDSQDAALDSDHDGLTNLQEYLIGTDPHDPQSSLRMEAARLANGMLELHFNVAVGKAYTIEYRDSLTSGTWTVLQELPVQTKSHSVAVTDNLPAGISRFYRIIVKTP